ncbi:MAG: transketolase-like TK C-terminal-containing protein [Terriglobia bacterium]
MASAALADRSDTVVARAGCPRYILLGLEFTGGADWVYDAVGPWNTTIQEGLNLTLRAHSLPSPVEQLDVQIDRPGGLEDIGYMTCMTMVLVGNYSQTGHFGGPLAYTPYNVAAHLAGPALGGLRYDYRRPKHPYGDKFMLAGGHNIPTGYALWMIMGQALERRFKATGDPRYHVDPKVAILPIDVLGFRRGAAALKHLLQDHGLADLPLFAQAKARGIKALAGHAESVDVTNDVNGGPSGIGIATSAGKAAFWNIVGAPSSLKVIALEGEFALTEGHAQELKTQALALQVGKRLRVLLSDNNAGIDDVLLGGVVDRKFDAYSLVDQWTSYGWNVLTLPNGNDYSQVLSALKTMEDWDNQDRRPMIVVGLTTKGYWPGAVNGKIPGHGDQLVSYPSHPYAQKMNSDYFVGLASTFEKQYGVTFEGIRQGPVTDPRERLVQFKTNIDVVMSVLERDGLGDWLADRLVEIGDTVRDDFPVHFDVHRDPFLDERLRVANLPIEPQKVTVTNRVSRAEKEVAITLFRKPGEIAGTRRAISEIIKWMNYVTDNRFFTIAADLSESINMEHGSLWGHYNPETNPLGTRIKAAIQEAGNVSTAIGLVSQSASVDPNQFAGVWAMSGTYGAFTPLMYTPARVWSQQNQDSRFRMGVLHILAAHSGPETAADARTHFGIFATQVWKLFPRGETIHLNFWDYNDVAPGYFAAAEIAARDPKVGIISIEVARPDFKVADRARFADSDLKAAAKGLYVIRDFAPGKPRSGYVLVQGSSSTVNLVSLLPRLEEAGLNVKVVAAVSEELFDRQPREYRVSVLPPEAYYDLMVVSTGTRRVMPVRNLGPLTDDYSLTSDWDNQWLTGGLEPEVIAEAHLDPESIFAGIQRFAGDRDVRLSRQRELLA